MRVKWTPEAKGQWRDTAMYILHKFGKNAKDVFMQEIRQTSMLLGKFPNMGKDEPLLADCKRAYRSIVVGRLNKIVYNVDNDIVYIVAFWDTRREPKTQAEQVNDQPTE